jgi:hypothetical protein
MSGGVGQLLAAGIVRCDGGRTQHDSGFSSLSGDGLSIVKTAADELDVRVRLGNDIAVRVVADKGADGVVGMGSGQRVQHVAADVASGSSA